MILTISQILLLLVIVLFGYLMWRQRKYFVLWWKIGGPCPIPLTVPIDMTNINKLLYAVSSMGSSSGEDWYKFSWMGPFAVLYISHPEVFQTTLTSPHCVDKPAFYSTLIDSFGYGLITENNPAWSKSRKLLNPLFTHKMILDFLPIFNKETNILNKILESLKFKDGVQLFPFFAKCTFDISNQTTMGKELHVQTAEHVDEWEAFGDMLYVSLQRIIQFWLLPKPIFNLTKMSKHFKYSQQKLHSWVQKLIANKIAENTDSNNNNVNESISKYEEDVHITKPKNIFIDHAYELVKKKEFTWEEFEDQAKHILLGSFETTATTIHNVIMLLAMHPQIQDRVFEEVKSLLLDMDSPVNYAETQEMIYLGMVINETLRLLPTVPIVAREVTNDIKIKGNVTVPKGTIIILDLFNLHRNKSVWGENIEKFDPERFLPDNVIARHPYAFVPFLKGIRNCIGFKYAGISMKIILSKIIRNYRFTTDFKLKDLHCIPAITLRFKENPKIKVHLRDS